MAIEDYTELIKAAQINFVSQNLDIVHIAYDKVKLGSRPYVDTVELSIATTATEKDKTQVTEGELWVLSKIEHRDIEPGIFTLRILLDGQVFFPSTTLNNLQFLLPLAKAYAINKYIETVVTNNDTVTKTYRCMRIWHIYNKASVNDFLKLIGAPQIK